MIKRTYHHGDLRRTLLAAAVEVIEESGPAALSLRDLARRAGVSHAAPTHHFRDKAGLLTALAAEGYRLLATELIDSAATSVERADSPAAGPASASSTKPHHTPTPGSDFLERGVAYVRFAITHRAHFEVMFRPELYHADDPELSAARQRARDALYTDAATLPALIDTTDLRDGGLAAWSMAHGFAMLWLNNSLPDLGTDPDAAARAILRHLRQG